MNHRGVEYSPDYKGFYRCPNKCGDPNYPQAKWKTESGFTKHLNECMGAEGWKPEPKPERKPFGTCPDCEAIIWEMESCWWMAEKVVCIGCYEEYFERGIGFHCPAGWLPPGITLEG